jgi:hypothetical protein
LIVLWPLLKTMTNRYWRFLAMLRGIYRCPGKKMGSTGLRMARWQPNFRHRSHGEGEIRFIDGPMPGNDSRWVEVDDLLSVSLLHNRLNELGEKTSLRVDE